MGFLTSFPPYLLSPCSLAALFKREKQRRKASSASLELRRREERGENREEQQQRHQEDQGGGASSPNNPLSAAPKRFSTRRRLLSVGPNWIMQSYNRHIRNHAVPIAPAPSRMKQMPPSQLGQFEVVPVHNCRLSNKTTAAPIGRRGGDLCGCCPIARSGHRIFADADFVYVLGGYNQILSNDKTYTDAWRFNRLTHQWQQCALADSAHPLPNTLASFSLVPTGGSPSNEVYIFGGTGFPFGQEATNKLHRIRIDAQGKIHIHLEEKDLVDSAAADQADEYGNNMGMGAHPEAAQFPPKMYGHAMCHRLERGQDGEDMETVYLAGGTTGHLYNMDVWRLERPARNSGKRAPWKAHLLNMHGFETGRYRLEAVLHRQTLFTFGGGAPDFCAEFNELLAFDLFARKFKLVKTWPDPVFGIPKGRKCHALVQRDHEVFIIGGCRDVPGQRDGRPEHQIIDDVWRFNLDTLRWSRVRTSLPVPVYFHSATLTPDGCIYVFGGCIDEDPQSQTRVNRLQRLWLDPPSLKFIAAQALLKGMPEGQRQRIGGGGKDGGGAVRLSDTEACWADGQIASPSRPLFYILAFEFAN